MASSPIPGCRLGRWENDHDHHQPATAGSLHREVRELARKEGISINQFVTTALAEKLSAMLTAEYLEQRAARGSRDRFERALSKVPDVEPEPGDRL